MAMQSGPGSVTGTMTGVLGDATTLAQRLLDAQQSKDPITTDAVQAFNLERETLTGRFVSSKNKAAFTDLMQIVDERIADLAGRAISAQPQPPASPSSAVNGSGAGRVRNLLDDSEGSGVEVSDVSSAYQRRKKAQAGSQTWAQPASAVSSQRQSSYAERRAAKQAAAAANGSSDAGEAAQGSSGSGSTQTLSRAQRRLLRDLAADAAAQASSSGTQPADSASAVEPPADPTLSAYALKKLQRQQAAANGSSAGPSAVDEQQPVSKYRTLRERRAAEQAAANGSSAGPAASDEGQPTRDDVGSKDVAAAVAAATAGLPEPKAQAADRSPTGSPKALPGSGQPGLLKRGFTAVVNLLPFGSSTPAKAAAPQGPSGSPAKQQPAPAQPADPSPDQPELAEAEALLAAAGGRGDALLPEPQALSATQPASSPINAGGSVAGPMVAPAASVAVPVQEPTSGQPPAKAKLASAPTTPVKPSGTDRTPVASPAAPNVGKVPNTPPSANRQLSLQPSPSMPASSPGKPAASPAKPASGQAKSFAETFTENTTGLLALIPDDTQESGQESLEQFAKLLDSLYGRSDAYKALANNTYANLYKGLLKKLKEIPEGVQTLKAYPGVKFATPEERGRFLFLQFNDQKLKGIFKTAEDQVTQVDRRDALVGAIAEARLTLMKSNLDALLHHTAELSAMNLGIPEIAFNQEGSDAIREMLERIAKARHG